MNVLQQQFYIQPSVDDPEEPLFVHTRPGSDCESIVIFVHGLGGKRYATWGEFPSLLFEDLNAVDIGMYQYRTLFGRLKFWRSLDVQDEGRILAEIIRDVSRYTKVVIVGHSMGGLVAKSAISYLLQTRQGSVLQKICGLVLMATPQLGSLRVLNFLPWFSRDFWALKPHGEFVLKIDQVFVNWLNTDPEIETLERPLIKTWAVIAASDFWVDKLSAGLGLKSHQTKLVRGSHQSIVKPDRNSRDGYEFVRDRISHAVSDNRHASLAITSPFFNDAANPKSDDPDASGDDDDDSGATELDLTIDELLRLEVRLESNGNDDTLRLDYGFFPFFLESKQHFPNEVFQCGCQVVRCSARVTTGSVTATSVTREPPNGQLVVEFGTGDRPRLRFQAKGNHVLDGQASLELSVAWTGTKRLSATVEPVLYGITQTDKAAQIKTSAVMLLNAQIEALQIGPLRRRISFQ